MAVGGPFFNSHRFPPWAWIILLILPFGLAYFAASLHNDMTSKDFKDLKGGGGQLLTKEAFKIQLQPLDERRANITLGELKPKVTLIVFWAGWCPPCLQEMPDLEALHNKYASKGLKIIAINVEEDRPLSEVQKIANEHNLTYFQTRDIKQNAQSLFNVETLPTTLLLDQNGVVRSRTAKAVSWMSSGAQKLIEDLLAEANSQP